MLLDPAIVDEKTVFELVDCPHMGLGEVFLTDRESDPTHDHYQLLLEVPLGAVYRIRNYLLDPDLQFEFRIRIRN